MGVRVRAGGVGDPARLGGSEEVARLQQQGHGDMFVFAALVSHRHS
jgi:hypothetical protein